MQKYTNNAQKDSDTTDEKYSCKLCRQAVLIMLVIVVVVACLIAFGDIKIFNPSEVPSTETSSPTAVESVAGLSLPGKYFQVSR